MPDSGRLAGLTTKIELAEAGFTKAKIQTLVRRDVLLPISRGVYADATRAHKLASSKNGKRALKLAAAVVIGGPHAAGSHHDAALMLGLDLLDQPPIDVAVTRPPGAAGSRSARAGIRLHVAALPSAHLTVQGGVPVTSLARTVVDLARSGSFESGVVVADSALRGMNTIKADLEAVIRSCARWPGIDRARQVVAFSDARAESPFESIARVAFRDSGLPPPDLQVWVADGRGDMIGRVDFMWRKHGVIAEADGAIKYVDPDQARRQLWRDARLRDAGFEVVHFTWRELIEKPEFVIQSIRAAIWRAQTLRTAGRRYTTPGRAI